MARFSCCALISTESVGQRPGYEAEATVKPLYKLFHVSMEISN